MSTIDLSALSDTELKKLYHQTESEISALNNRLIQENVVVPLKEQNPDGDKTH